MSTIYDIDTDQQVIELLPPDKRFAGLVAFFQVFLRSTVQWLRNRLLDDYRNGSTAPAYVAGTYAYGAFVNYQKGIYVSLIDNNTDAPTVTASWYKTQNNFIGLNERILYNGNTIVLEYALNRWFGTTFRQPGTGLSDIYLLTNAKPLAIFRFAVSEAISTAVYLDRSTQFVFNNDSVNTAFVNLTINVPLAVYNALDTIPTNRDAIIRSFADKYVYSGITYNIVTY